MSTSLGSRKRDAMGRFSSGTSGSALAQFGREDGNFKRPRGVQGGMPGYPGRVGAFGTSGQAPPSAANLAAGYSSGMVDFMSNSTSSLPVQARPWSAACAVGDFSQGALLFVRKDNQHASYKSVADLPTANWILRHARDTLASRDPTKNHGGGSNADNTHGWKGEQGWNYMGSLRNKYKAPASLLTLMNVDCFGRSKVGNIFDSKVKTGDRVGMALVPVNLHKYPFLAGPGNGSRNTAAYCESLKSDNGATEKNKTWSAKDMLNGRADDFQDGDKHTVWQWLPTLNGKVATYVAARLFDDPQNPPDFIDHVSIGCVSNALHSGRSTVSNMLEGLLSTDAYTLLPQLEVLIE